MKKIKFWLRNARAGSLVQSLMPAVVAVVFSVFQPRFSLFLAVLAVVGVACAHLTFNLVDDYFDYRSHETGYRDMLARAGFRAYTAKCPYITEGKATLQDLKKAIFVFAGITLGCGAVIFFFRGWSVLVIAAITAFLGVFYSGAPLRLSYHGLGEPVIGVIFGPLNVMGVSLASCGVLCGECLLAGVIFGLLVTNILYCHSVLDYEADQSVNKKTFAGLFSTGESRLSCSFILIFASYGMIAAAVLLGRYSAWYLIVFLSLPYAVDLFRSMKRFQEDPKAPVVWKKWYGNAGMDWSQTQAAGLDWFLQRWLLARNLVAVIAVCLMAGCILSHML